MVVDLSKIRPGDEVTVRMTVNSIRAGCGVALAFEAREPTVLSALEGRIVSHTPKALQAGDRVRPTDENSKLLGEIIAIYGAEAWVKWERDAGPATELLRRLERAP